METRVRTGRNEKGQQTAAWRVQKYLVPFLGHMRVSKVTADHLRDYRVWLERRCRTPATVRHILGDARNRLLEIPEPYLFVVKLALGTGLRWGELCRSQARDVQDVSERGFDFILILLEQDDRKTHSVREHGFTERLRLLVVSQTKSGKVRRVPLDPELLKLVKSRVGRLVGFSHKSPGSFANAIRKRTGIEGFHVHQLRHTFACRWIERGGSLAALQEILGHSSVVVTQRYARLSDDMVKEKRCA